MMDETGTFIRILKKTFKKFWLIKKLVEILHD